MLETIEVSRIKRFAANTAGRDLVVGDIHGHFTLLNLATLQCTPTINPALSHDWD